MDKITAQRIVRDTFKAPFDRKRYRDFINELCNGFDESKAQNMGVPDAFAPHVKSCQRLGTFTAPGGELADVLIVQLTESYKLERSRTALRDFVAHKLKRDESYKEAGFVAFVADSQSWRFSYVHMEYETKRDPKTGKIKAEERLTPARRFSYLVGADEECHTAQARFLALLQNTTDHPTLAQIEEAFSVESVTKEFFREYARLFEDTEAALALVVKQDKTIRDDFDAKGVRTVDFAKKLLGQIVFLYFIQKKGWLGVARGGKWGDGPRNFMRLLANRAIHEKKCLFNDVLEPLFYDTLAADRNGAWCETFECRIPFLNGGLFEPLAGYDWQNTEIKFANTLFTNSETSPQGDTGTGILDVFDRYNFTVNEAEPLEMEVAIDPEMLGKVFENLIEENRRKGLGAFYTPREFVHYMCQESLINYLDNGLNRPATPRAGESIAVPRKDVEDWIRQSDQFAHYAAAIAAGTKGDHYPKPPESIRKFPAEIDALLRDITVCDPAIGSGAFPVGMMTEIVRARVALTPYFSDVAERTPYHFKRHAIQTSLYGVDIDAGAVEIAKLRLWLSLVVDEEDVQHIQPLPNLDYKIVAGNSLLGFPFKSQRLHELETLKQRFFDETDHDTKAKLKLQIDSKIQQCLEASKRSLGYAVTFDFEVLFSEVFGTVKGFDVVIANPPYGVRIPTDERKIYAFTLGAVPDFEIFYWFLSLAVKITRQGGTLSYIIPNTFLINMYATDYRRLFLEKWRVHNLVDLSQLSIFDSAVVRNCVLITERRDKADYIALVSMFGESASGEIAQVKVVSVSKAQLHETAENWQLLVRSGSKSDLLLSKIVKSSVPLGEILDAKQGYIPYRTTTLTKRFGAQEAKRILTERQWHSDSQASPHHKRELQGKDVLRYGVAWSGVWVKYGNWVSSYVDVKYFSEPRLMFREITAPMPYALIVAYSAEEYVNNPSVITAIHRGSNEYDFNFLLGVCNSRLISFCFAARAPKADKGLFPKILVNDVRQIPIANASKEARRVIGNTVSKVVDAKKQNPQADTNALEREIDEMVYALYDLTPAEIKLVEEI
jgi:type I restriction-modification system DNA methylase subunit